jgi:dCTP deaminase
MVILSKAEIIKRIMIGEVWINPGEAKSVAQCLQCLSKHNLIDAEKIFNQHFKRINDPKNPGKRKIIIRDLIENNFLNKTSEKLKSDTKKVFEGIEDLKGFVKDIDSPILIDCVNPECLQMANYDLELGEEVYVTTEKVPKKLNAMGKDGVVSIEPGEFGILMTNEYIFVPPDLMGFISVRLTHKQKGLVNISGFHVDPGFYGRLLFAVFNAGPNDVPLRYKEPVFMIMFNKLTEDGPIVKKGRWRGMENIPIETLSGLRGTSVSVRGLDKRIRRLEIVFPILLTAIVGLIVEVIIWILTNSRWQV